MAGTSKSVTPLTVNTEFNRSSMERHRKCGVVSAPLSASSDRSAPEVSVVLFLSCRFCFDGCSQESIGEVIRRNLHLAQSKVSIASPLLWAVTVRRFLSPCSKKVRHWLTSTSIF